MTDCSALRELIRNAKWQDDTPLSQYFLPNDLRGWLCAKGSLTAALRQISNNSFEVEVVSQTKRTPFNGEAKLLNLTVTSVAVVREVKLKIYDEPVIFARSVIPMKLALPGRFGLNNLGKTPLGHLLFKDGRMRASRREFATQFVGAEKVHARRTPYEYRDSSILVSEFFLPSLKKYI